MRRFSFQSFGDDSYDFVLDLGHSMPLTEL